MPKSVTSQDQRYQSYKVLKSGNNFIEKTEKSLSKKKKKKGREMEESLQAKDQYCGLRIWQWR